VLDLFSEAMEIEIVCDVLLVHFCEKLVALQIAEPLDPAVSRLTVVVIVQILIYISCNCRVRLGTCEWDYTDEEHAGNFGGSWLESDKQYVRRL